MLKYDVFGRTKGLTAFVLDPVRKPLCQINGITVFEASMKFNEISEIQFEVQRFEINKSTLDLQEVEAYKYLHSFCQIYVPELGKKGYFLIHTEPTIVQESTRRESKSFVARSYESILEHESLTDFVVNCGTDESLEMVIPDNLDDIGSPIKKIRLYDKYEKKFSLLDLVLKDDYYGWTIGHVDTTIAGLERSFEVTNQTVYSFLHADVSQAFRCIFDFNVEDKEINVYDIETIGKDTNIYLSIDHFLQQIQIAPRNEFCYTVFNVAGDGDLGIDLVNFGSNKIVNIDYPLSLINEELLAKYKAYESIRESLRDQYYEVQKEYADIINKEAATLDRQPDDHVNYNWKSPVDYDVQGLKDMLQSMKNACRAIELLYTDENGYFDKKALEESDDAALYYSYHDVCIPDLRNEIKAREDGTGYTYEPVEQRFIWGIQGLNDLLDTKDYLNEQISAYVAQGYDKSWSKSTGISKETFNDHKAALKKCRERLKECNAYIAKRQAKYKELQTAEKECIAELKDIAKRASLEHYTNYGTVNVEDSRYSPIKIESELDNINSEDAYLYYVSFTAEEIKQIKELYRESDYQNTNFVITDYDDIVSTAVVANELYDDAKKELFIESQPQYTWSVTSDDLFAMREFDPLRDQLELGCYVWLGRYSKAFPAWTMAKQKFRVMELDFSGLREEPEFSIVFSTMQTTKLGRNDFEELLDNAVTSSVNSISRGVSNTAAETAKNVTTSLIKPYIEALRAKIDALDAQKITVQDLTAINALIENLTVYDLKAGNIEADESIVLSNRDGYGSVVLKNSQMTFNDEHGDVRVKIGKDTRTGEYIINIYGPANENGVQELLWGSSGVTPSAIGDSLITRRMLGAREITNEKIDDEAITADKIAANSITVNKLVVGDMSNLATVNENDPNSMVASPAGMATKSVTINTETGVKGVRKVDDTQQYLALSQPRIPNIFSIGDELYYSIMIGGSAARDVTLRVYAYDSQGNSLGSSSSSITIGTIAATKKGTLTISGDYWARAASYTLLIRDTQVDGSYGRLTVLKADVRKKRSGDLIVGGQIEGASFKTAAGPGYTVNYFSRSGVVEPELNTKGDMYAFLDSAGLKYIQSSTGIERSVLYPMIFREYTQSEQPLGEDYGWMCPNLFFAVKIYTADGAVASYSDLSDIRLELNGHDDEGNIQYFDPNTFTPSASGVSTWDTLGKCWFYKIGTRVHLHVAVTGLHANTNENIYTLPEGYRPYGITVAAGRGSTGSVFASMWVAANGAVTVRSNDTNAAIDIEYDAFN